MTNPIDKPSEAITGKKPIESEKPLSQPPSTFESYMQGSKGGPAAPQSSSPMAGAQGPSPMTIAQGAASQTAPPTFDSLQAQSKNVQDTIGTVSQQLNTQNLKLKRSQTHLLKNKLQDANDHIRAAGNQLGIQAPPIQMPSGGGPVDRFLAYLGDGQDQMIAIQDKLKELSAKPGSITPAAMLLVQVKMNQASQEISYASALLSKIVDSLKQILSTQL